MQGFVKQTGIIGFLQGVKDLCFPVQCLVCGMYMAGKKPPLFCEFCAEKIALIREPLCRLCGKPFFKAAGAGHLCGACLSARWHFAGARSLIVYDETVAGVIQRFKYNGDTTGLSSFAALQKELAYLQDSFAPDLIVPVPLHWQRLRQRGFNQALLLARVFFPGDKEKISVNALERFQKTLPQAGLSGVERRRNIKASFRVQKKPLVVGRKILLVDDVFTTGTTVNECARVLVFAGASEVRVLTLARSAL